MTADCGLRGLQLLDLVIAQIEAHPEAWRQASYRCRTGMCVAGWTAELAGGRWLTTADSLDADYLLPEDGDGYLRSLPAGDIESLLISADADADILFTCADNRAQRLLGLGNGDALALFAPGNTPDDIRSVRDELRARESPGSAA